MVYCYPSHLLESWRSKEPQSIPTLTRDLSPQYWRNKSPNKPARSSRNKSPSQSPISWRSNSPTKSPPSWRSNSPTTSLSSWRKDSPNTSRESSFERPVASTYSEGDIIQLPDDLADGSEFKQNLDSGLYGRATRHPLVVLEVFDEYIVCAQMTSFTAIPFREKCSSTRWAARYIPIGHKEHPYNLFGSWTLELECGKMHNNSYANVEAPLVIEAWACKPFVGDEGGPVKLRTDSLQWLRSQCAAYDLPRQVKYDYWRSRQSLRKKLPNSKALAPDQHMEPPLVGEYNGEYFPQYMEKCVPAGAKGWRKNCLAKW